MWHWLLLLFFGWMAATVSGAVGFGGALLLLPVLTFVVGGKSAIPILAVAQLLGNLSRAGFGWREIRWRPVLAFSAGAIPASIIGSRLFVAFSSPVILRAVGIFLLFVVALRHTRFGQREISRQLLAPAGVVVGFVSAIAGSAGPLGATVFLSLKLPPQAYIASEAVTAVLMHVTKTITYGRYAALSPLAFLQGIVLGGSLVLGSWTGRKLISRLPEREFSHLIEILLVLSAVMFLMGWV